MNIFMLSNSPKRAARYHCDKHVVKMPLEYAQMLCTNLRMTGVKKLPYKSTHTNHPSTIWARETQENFSVLCDMLFYTSEEYKRRYGREHKALTVMRPFLRDKFIARLPDGDMTDFAMAMPDFLKSKNPVQSYRMFYHFDKFDFADWKYSKRPYWYHPKVWWGTFSKELGTVNPYSLYPFNT